MKKFFPALALLLVTPFAYGGISEIKTDFPNQTGPMGPSTVVTTGSGAAASYLLCIANYNSPVRPTLAWTDENNNPQSWTPPIIAADGYGYYGCDLIRNHAGDSVKVSTAGSTGLYSLTVFGFGFWPGQPQKQGGITETVLGVNGTASISGDPVLFLFTGDNTCEIVIGAPGLPASFSLTAPAIFPFIIAAAGYVTTEQISGSGTCNSSNELAVISFGTPSTGSGPLTDYEYDMLDWTDAAYPYYKTVFTAGDSGANFLLATNIAEKPNSSTVAEEITLSWPGANLSGTQSDLTGEPSGAPASAVLIGFVPAADPVEFLTFNATGQAWGHSPTYSAEVDVIQF
jgi:hypothetical protein